MTNNDAFPSNDADLPALDSADEAYDVEISPQYGYWGFTLRELNIIGAWLIAFVVSFFPLGAGGGSVWSSGLHWVLTIGVPTVAVFLIVLRRFSPDGIRRVGSLGIDQFASVAFSVSAVLWIQHVWDSVSFALRLGSGIQGWVMWVELVCMLGLVLLTVGAPLIPGLKDDFEGRMDTLAHRSANPVRPVIAFPLTPATPAVVDAPAPQGGDDDDLAADAGDPDASADRYSARSHAAGGEPGAAPRSDGDDVDYEPSYLRRSGSEVATEQDAYAAVADDPVEHAGVPVADAPTDVITPFEAEAEEYNTEGDSDDAQAPASDAGQPFWALAPEVRPVHDEQGEVLFEIGPDAWILVIEDRGGAYVVRHDDGRVGYLHDTTNMTRG